MERRVHVLVGIAVTLVCGADLTARFVLGKDLLSIAATARVPSTSISSVEKGGRVITLERPRYQALVIMPAGCKTGEACTFSVLIQPVQGRELSTDAPYALSTKDRDASVSRSQHRFAAEQPLSPSRALIDVSLDAAPRTLEGELFVVTCASEQCKIDRDPISIPLG